MVQIKDQIKERLAADFDIKHSTLEFECMAHKTARSKHQTEMIPPHRD